MLRRVLAWQNEIYCSDLPEWLRDALVQGFYSLAKNSVWIARTRKDDWWGEDGWFTHSESHTGCPIVETMVCRMHGHFALLFFFPELETTTLDALRHFQISSGEIPFSFGAPTSMRDPRYTSILCAARSEQTMTDLAVSAGVWKIKEMTTLSICP